MNFAEVGKTIGADFKTADIVGDFKKRGILPADNISDPANEIYQSDTGEILMDVKKRRLTVSTPKSQAAVLNAGEGANLGDFNVKSCGADASVAVVSIDGKPIRGSSRMVLVFATDTVTSGVGLSSARRKINAWGKPPILVQTAKLSAELKLDASKKFDFFQAENERRARGENPLRNRKRRHEDRAGHVRTRRVVLRNRRTRQVAETSGAGQIAPTPDFFARKRFICFTKTANGGLFFFLRCFRRRAEALIF